MMVRTLTPQDRSALLQFEDLYGQWRTAVDAWLAAEVLLWTEALRAPYSPEIARLGAEAARHRDTARNAYLRVMEALAHAGEK
ncbi:hypothetical protein ACPWT1_08520 [Ramlibacter sp. MMS24-I3-19]|uniref:hypothetical protein n=1 Tax=Ramlibacter sp. MMS24-I3-19 TaxID=3416606 RepID=UPI003D00FCC6